MHFWERRRTAGSSIQGRLVAARTRTPSLSLPTPSIWTRNSVFMQTVFSPEVLFASRLPASASISSMKMMDSQFSCARLNRLRNEPFALANPLGRHVAAANAEQRVVALGCHRLRRVRLACSGGGPWSRMARQALRFPWCMCGKRVGKMTASCNSSLALSSPATSSQHIFSFSVTIESRRPSLSCSA